jgi:hypothetical protein
LDRLFTVWYDVKEKLIELQQDRGAELLLCVTTLLLLNGGWLATTPFDILLEQETILTIVLEKHGTPST